MLAGVLRHRRSDAAYTVPGLTTAEACAAALMAGPASAILAAYAFDLAGLRFTPARLLPIVLVSAAATWRWTVGGAARRPYETVMFLGVGGAVAAWLLWLAWPGLLPLSTGPDLTHHLLLIHYIEQHWRLVHDPALESYLGEMAQYTPGSHILAALAGAWSRTDGLRALHPVQTLVVALTAGVLWLITVRLLPARVPRPLALIAVCLLLAAPRYAVGLFTEFGFVAQVVAELFAIGMWWAAVVWDQARSPDWRICALFSAAAAAAFLTWPVYSAAPVVTMGAMLALRTEVPLSIRLRHAAIAFGPCGLVAAAYLVGRLGWLQMAGTGGDAPVPSVAAYSWPLVVLSSLGALVCARRRRGRATVLFLLAVLAQAVAFYVIARRAHAPQPYLALKMFYLLLWPMAACAAAALGEAWTLVPEGRAARGAAWLAAALVLVLVARPLIHAPRRLHPRPAAVTGPLYEAGRWAQVHLPAGCVEYLVGDDETAYWLHLAVLGNPRMSARTGDNSTYEPQDAVLRWLTPGGLPYAIVDLPAVPRAVRDELDIVQRFGTAAIARRRGAGSCPSR